MRIQHPRCARFRAALFIAGFVVCASLPRLSAQGALTPPGAPAPTMKSLDELAAQLTAADAKSEARIAIDTLSGNASALYVIGQPGSYYLRGNITVGSAALSAIRVNTSNVTIDLNGFSLTGPGFAVSTAAGVSTAFPRVSVRNGTISNFLHGVSLNAFSVAEHLAITDVGGSGAALSVSTGIARHVAVQNASSNGIVAALVENCTVSAVSNAAVAATKYGIDAVVVRHCAVQSVVATGASWDAYGIRAQVVESCRVHTLGSGRSSYGIHSGETSTGRVRDCSVYNIQATSAAYGVLAGSVTGTTANLVVSDGTQTVGLYGTTVDNCVSTEITNNGAASYAAGIYADVVSHSRVSIVNAPDQDSYGIRATHISDCVVNAVGIGLASGTGVGLAPTNSAVVRNNSVYNCRTFGIRVGSTSLIAGNTISGIGTGVGITDGTGIYPTGNDNRIEGNSIIGGSGCDYGIRMTATRNLVIGNRASSTFGGAATGASGLDTPEFNISGGNRFGPIATAAANGELTATNPFANYSD